MKQNRLLTVAIPTYNRRKQIQQQVRAILPQLTDEVELMIIDNHSPYDIKALFSLEELSKMKIVVNAVNIGMSANYARCLEYPDTQWVWTLSDDDMVLPNAVNTVLNAVKEYPNAISICLNSLSDFETNKYTDFFFFFHSHVNYSMHFWMSVCVYNLSYLRSYLYCGFNELTTMMAPFITVLKYLEIKGEGQCLMLCRQIIKDTEKNTSWEKTDFLIRVSFVYDIFRNDRKKMLRTLFYGCTELNLCLLYEGLKQVHISPKNALYILRLIMFKYGIVNVIRFFPSLYFRILISLIFPKISRYVKLLTRK